MKPILISSAISAALTLMAASAEVDCLKLSLTVKEAVAAEHANILEIVASQVSANPGCSCEIVKAAIEGSNAKPDTVAAIVEVAVTAAPDQMRLVSQCAVAVAPDALAKVQVVLAKLDPNCGKTGARAHSSKDAKAPVPAVETLANPLDFPQQGVEKPQGNLSGVTSNGTTGNNGTSGTTGGTSGGTGGVGGGGPSFGGPSFGGGGGPTFGGGGGQPTFPVVPPLSVTPPPTSNVNG